MDASPYGASTFSQGGVTEGPLFYFTTPLVRDIPNYLPTSKGDEIRLWRHYRLKERGVNVFVLSDGSVAQDTATTENANSGYPLPWNLTGDYIVDLKNDIAYVTNWDGTVTHTYLDPKIQYVYEGGHTHTINQSEASFLTAAGYGAYITPL